MGYLESVAVLALAALVQDDLAAIGAGVLASQGAVPLAAAVVGCALGIAVGDFMWMGAGRLAGGWLLRHPPLVWLVRPEQVELSERWVRRNGPVVVLATRCLPGLRTPTYLAIGTLHTRLRSLVLYELVAATLWALVLVNGARWLGQRAQQYLEYLEVAGPVGVVLVALALWLGLKLLQSWSAARAARRIARQMGARDELHK